METQIEAMLRGAQFKQLMENYVKNLRERYGLKRMEIEVLYYLRHCGEKNTAKDITLSLHMNKGHISQTTESLVEKSYITGTRDTRDYRIVHYTLTEDADRVTEEIDEAISRLYGMLFEGIPKEDMDALSRIAARMTLNISKILSGEN